MGIDLKRKWAFRGLKHFEFDYLLCGVYYSSRDPVLLFCGFGVHQNKNNYSWHNKTVTGEEDNSVENEMSIIQWDNLPLKCLSQQQNTWLEFGSDVIPPWEGVEYIMMLEQVDAGS